VAVKSKIPEPIAQDSEDVSWALSTAQSLASSGDGEEALKWLRRAANNAADAEQDERAVELFKVAADIASEIDEIDDEDSFDDMAPTEGIGIPSAMLLGAAASPRVHEEGELSLPIARALQPSAEEVFDHELLPNSEAAPGSEGMQEQLTEPVIDMSEVRADLEARGVEIPGVSPMMRDNQLAVDSVSAPRTEGVYSHQPPTRPMPERQDYAEPVDPSVDDFEMTTEVSAMDIAKAGAMLMAARRSGGAPTPAAAAAAAHDATEPMARPIFDAAPEHHPQTQAMVDQSPNANSAVVSSAALAASQGQAHEASARHAPGYPQHGGQTYPVDETTYTSAPDPTQRSAEPAAHHVPGHPSPSYPGHPPPGQSHPGHAQSYPPPGQSHPGQSHPGQSHPGHAQSYPPQAASQPPPPQKARTLASPQMLASFRIALLPGPDGRARCVRLGANEPVPPGAGSGTLVPASEEEARFILALLNGGR
jgi:hypothetical protein